MHKIVVLGVEALNPQMVKQWLDDLPNLKRMQEEGIWGDLESVVPPGAPQAWISSQCGQNPGAFGLWGRTYRVDFSYDETGLADSQVVDERVDRLHRILPKQGQKVALINAPVTWPPPEIPGGYCVSDFVPKGGKKRFTWPESLREEVNSLVGAYESDVLEAETRHGQRGRKEIVTRIREMDNQRFTLLKHFFREKKCDYVFAVLTGIPLLHKLIWDESGPQDSGGVHEDALHDYYTWIDTNLGHIRQTVNGDTVLVVYSPYSVERSEGHINLNEWLIHNGYLALHEYPRTPTPFKNLNVDWAKTKCWSVGNSGKIYINLKGRETRGIVETHEYDALLDEIGERISETRDTRGKGPDGQLFKREDIHFGEHEALGPDLFIVFHEVPWHTIELVGHGLGEIWSCDKTGSLADVCNGLYGYFSMWGSDVPAAGELTSISVLNIAPTVLDILRLDTPISMEKPSVLSMAKEKHKESPASRKEKVRSRLKALGY
jgi:predicted AlkP superfamily phosphohydrolase/phosphomutase